MYVHVIILLSSENSTFDITIKQMIYRSVLDSLKTNTANLTPSTADIPEVVCRADTMIKYREKLSELEALLEQYKALLQKDYVSMKSVENNMLQMDDLIAGRFLR